MSKQSNDLRQRGWLLRALQAAFIAVLLQNCLLYLLESPLHSQAASIPLRHHHLRPVIPSPETQEPSLFDLDISHNEEAGNETASETETHGTGLQKRTLGTPVSEGHARYELVYALLTGLKSSVLVSDAQKAIPLQDQDFTATQKWHFDTKGSSGAAPSKYSFQFKDYAPQVFRALRRNHGIRADEYLRSLAGTLTGSYMMFEMGSPGRSGSTFYISQDERYLIKTVTPAQHKHLRRILKSYHRHTTTYPNTLLNRIYGLHRVKSFALGSIHFAVFANVFPADVDIHEVYDLKGSSVGRYLTEEQAKNSKRPVWKDKNFVERGRKLELGPAKSELLVKQMEVDVE
ncbi:Phosphatidylinositol-4-phosphate 5-kinase, partial [Quaeritorhiza haematococci]